MIDNKCTKLNNLLLRLCSNEACRLVWPFIGCLVVAIGSSLLPPSSVSLPPSFSSSSSSLCWAVCLFSRQLLPTISHLDKNHQNDCRKSVYIVHSESVAS